ncbi:hypothetical protein BHM03_00028317, partial [Ensete ventricosum]
PSLIRLSVADHGGVMLVQFREGGAASDPRLDIRTTDTLRWHHQVVDRSIHPVFTLTMPKLIGKIKLVPIDLENRPAWYKEKVYPANKVPSLEHNNEVKGESLDLIKYIDKYFEGPELLPDVSNFLVFVDIAYAPFIERFQTFLKEELNKIDAYTHTKQDPQVLLAITKKRLGVKYH